MGAENGKTENENVKEEVGRKFAGTAVSELDEAYPAPGIRSGAIGIELLRGRKLKYKLTQENHDADADDRNNGALVLGLRKKRLATEVTVAAGGGEHKSRGVREDEEQDDEVEQGHGARPRKDAGAENPRQAEGYEIAADPIIGFLQGRRRWRRLLLRVGIPLIAEVEAQKLVVREGRV